MLFPTNIHLLWTPFTVKCISLFQVYLYNVVKMYIWSLYCNNCKWPFSQYIHNNNSKGQSFKLDFSLQMSKRHGILCETLLNPCSLVQNRSHLWRKKKRLGYISVLNITFVMANLFVLLNVDTNGNFSLCVAFLW